MIDSLADLPPDSLTALLRESGQLPAGEVNAIEVNPEGGQFGKSHQLYHLSVHYRGTGPEQLFLKFGKSRKEYFFYTTLAPEIGIPPLIHCYAAVFSPERDQTCLLLEDLSASHYQTEWPLPPPVSLCEQTIEVLAGIHAQWWQNPRLENEFRPVLPPGRSWRDRRALAVEHLPAFLDFLGDRLSPQRHRLYERVATWAGLELPPGRPAQTLLHGDMHFWNVLYPHSPGKDIRLFDWNMWDIGSPTDDLAYLLAVHWYPERRARWEINLLQRYHRRLTECGITGYAWDDCWLAYRASVIRSLLIPVWQWVRGILPGVWWSHLERTWLAFDDLRAIELL